MSNAEDSLKFAEVLTNPPEPSKALKRAAGQRKSKIAPNFDSCGVCGAASTESLTNCGRKGCPK